MGIPKDRQAPPGQVWVCTHCGKTAEDRFGMEGNVSPDWTETCVLNAKLFYKNMLKFREGTNEVEEIILPDVVPEKKTSVTPPKVTHLKKGKK